MPRRAGVTSRREILQAGVAATVGLRLGGRVMASNSEQGGPATPPLTSVKALVFDTFGTVVDWRTSITSEVEELAAARA